MFGYSPSQYRSTRIQLICRPSAVCSSPTMGTLFSVRQATTHASQPVHLSRSMTIPQCGISSPQKVSDKLKFGGQRGVCLLTFQVCATFEQAFIRAESDEPPC